MKRHVVWTMAAILVIVGGSVRSADEPKEDEVKKEVARFQDGWRYESLTRNGEAMSAEDLKKLRIVFEGDKFKIFEGSKATAQGTLKLDPIKKPKTVDFIGTEGDIKGLTILGIYEIDGDTIRWCYDPSGKKRPTEFKAAEREWVLAVLKREKDKK